MDRHQNDAGPGKGARPGGPGSDDDEIAEERAVGVRQVGTLDALTEPATLAGLLVSVQGRAQTRNDQQRGGREQQQARSQAWHTEVPP